MLLEKPPPLPGRRSFITKEWMHWRATRRLTVVEAESIRLVKGHLGFQINDLLLARAAAFEQFAKLRHTLLNLLQFVFPLHHVVVKVFTECFIKFFLCGFATIFILRVADLGGSRVDCFDRSGFHPNPQRSLPEI